jgi:hypothetical protein
MRQIWNSPQTPESSSLRTTEPEFGDDILAREATYLPFVVAKGRFHREESGSLS